MTEEEYIKIRKKIKKKTPKEYVLVPVARIFSTLLMGKGLSGIFPLKEHYNFINSDFQALLHQRSIEALIIGAIIFILSIVYLVYIDRLAKPWKELKQELDENWENQNAETFKNKISDLKITQS